VEEVAWSVALSESSVSSAELELLEVEVEVLGEDEVVVEVVLV
jgi:hypothetical protein